MGEQKQTSQEAGCRFGCVLWDWVGFTSK